MKDIPDALLTAHAARIAPHIGAVARDFAEHRIVHDNVTGKFFIGWGDGKTDGPYGSENEAKTVMAHGIKDHGLAPEPVPAPVDPSPEGKQSEKSKK